MSLKKKILVAIEKARILRRKADMDFLTGEVQAPPELIEEELGELKAEDYIREDRGNWALTPKGRGSFKVGVIGGVFDLLHVGHIATLMEAKKHCDLLVVIVARDEVVLREKGRLPVNPEERRLLVVNSLKPVDVAILGDLKNFRKPVDLIKPDVIILGYDQRLPAQLEGLGRELEVVKLDVHIDGESTTNILNRITKMMLEGP